AGLTPERKALLKNALNFYVLDVKNVGGLVSPVILEVEYEDGSREEQRIPAEIWRRNADQVSKLLLTEKTIARITLDPHLETADTDLTNNVYPPRVEETRVELTSGRDDKAKNPMQEAREAAEKAAAAA